MRIFAMLAACVLATASPVAAAPLDGLHDLAGMWSCTYRAGAAHMTYTATYAFDLDRHLLRETATWAGGGDEELIAYDPHHGWSAVVFDDHGTTTIMHATGRDPRHIAYRSSYPDASLAVSFDRASATEYFLHATYRTGGKTIASVDTCLRAAH